MGKQSPNLIKTNRGKVAPRTELFSLALYELYFFEHKLHFYFLMQRMNKLNTCFEDRSRHSVWHHVIICLFYSIHVSLRNHGSDVRAEYTQHMLKEEGSI